MKKKLLAFALAGAMVLSMAACGGNSGAENSTGDSGASNALENIQESGVLKVSTSPDFAPYEFEDPSKSGQDAYVGADMELARYIAEQLDVELEIVPMSFDACLAGVTQNKVDISISGFYPSEERRKTVDFTDAYFDDSEQCVVINKADMDKYKTAEDFVGASLAAQNGSAQADVAESQAQAKVQLVKKTTDGIQMVKANKCAGIVLQAVMADSVIASDDSLAIAAPEYTYDEGELVVAVNKGETELTEKLNEIIKDVNDQGLYGQWIVEAQELAQTITE